MANDWIRCGWAVGDEEMVRYHDEEWGTTPVSDEAWFEMIVLETFQAGLSWRTVLRKRNAFRHAFRGFSVNAVASFSEEDVASLLMDEGIIRNRQKIEAAVKNARIASDLILAHGSLESAFQQVKDEEEILRYLSSTFVRVGRTTAESIAFATGLIPPPHDDSCFMSQTVSHGRDESE